MSATSPPPLSLPTSHQLPVDPGEKSAVDPSEVQQHFSSRTTAPGSVTPPTGQGEATAVAARGVGRRYMWRINGKGVLEIRVDGYVVALRETQRICGNKTEGREGGMGEEEGGGITWK